MDEQGAQFFSSHVWEVGEHMESSTQVVVGFCQMNMKKGSGKGVEAMFKGMIMIH
jgi:hypothetical protein